MTSQPHGIAPGSLRAWLIGTRPPTLTAGIAPVAVGSAVALRDGVFEAGPAFAALVGALALQIGANFANDRSDFRRGADTIDRIGPARVTQLGLLTERQVLAGMVASFLAATIAGLYLSVVLIGFRIARRAPDRFGQLLAIGIASLVALHAVLHMGVGLGLVPPTGLSLPLVSYGRSNLLVMLMGIGILLSVARGTAPIEGRAS